MVGGRDRAKFLQGMLTNDIVKLAKGQSILSSILSPKGKLVAEFIVHHWGESFALESDRSLQNTIESNLKKYVLGADVTFSTSPQSLVFSFFGPEAEKKLTSYRNDTVFIGAFDFPVRPTFTILSPKEISAEGAPLSEAAYEALRIEAGIPRFGMDVTEDQLLLEVPHLALGVSYTKGCYIGQETIARLHARGENLAWRLMGVVSEGEIQKGDSIRLGEKVVGKVTSTTYSPRFRQNLALALIHRDAFEPGTTVSIPAGEAKVVSLP